MLSIDRPADGVAVLTLRRPEKRNALSIELRDRLSDALDALAADESCSAVVITGSGPVFCAGFDLKEFAVTEPGFHERLWASSDRFHRTVLTFPLPVVAAVNGPAIAGGFDLAVMCDVRVAATTAEFSHPELAFGDVVYGPLQELVGGSLARDLCLTGRTLGAEEALAVRFVSEVVAPEAVLTRGIATATAIARAPRPVLLRTKAKIIRRASVVTGDTLSL